ncbi:MAG: transcription termination/antitermination protein NusA [Anaerolineales bacterium]|nr:transcription termination/antitermination protein NusA [Anaerolineales bacterium]
MKNEFVLAFNEVLEEKGLPREVVIEALEAAMISAYRRAVNASGAQHVEAKIDLETGKVVIHAEKEVVEDVQDERTEVTLKQACQVNPEAQLGDMVVVETTPKDFGRVAAQTARQVIQQRIREAERDSQTQHYAKQVGEIVSGVIQAITPQGITLGLDMKAEGILPRNQQIPGERYRVHDRVQSLLLEVKQTPRGPQIILSRSHRNFLRRLLENEVPEIYHGLVEIRSIAREPGQRSKVAVAALQPAVDPVGACVGIRGVRIQAIVRELNDEKIDVIEYDTDPSAYIAKALSPARVTGVYLNEHAKGAKTATVVVMDDQLSLAIGRDGQNARLAAKLTSWRIDIKSLMEAATDAINQLQNNPDYAFLAASEEENVPRVEAVLAKKAEGRSIPPEEYQMLSQFVDRVERGLITRRTAEKRAEEEIRKAARATIPDAAFEMPLENLGLSERVFGMIQEAGYHTIGDLMLQMAIDSDAILRINGVGPKTMTEINERLAGVSFPSVEEEAPQVVEPEVIEVVQPAEELVSVFAEEAEAQPSEEPIPVELPVSLPEMVEPAMQVEALTPVEAEAVATAGIGEESATESEPSLDDLFSLKLDEIVVGDEDEEDDEEDTGKPGDPSKKKKKKAKKKSFVEVTYDPDRDVTLVKRKRKRGEDWGNEWDF